MKRVWSSGEEESVFADGTVQKLQANGNRVIEYTNGQKETHTKDYKVCVHVHSTALISSLLFTCSATRVSRWDSEDSVP